MAIYIDGRTVVSGETSGFVNVQNPKDLAVLVYQAINGNDTYAQLIADALNTLAGTPTLQEVIEAGDTSDLDITITDGSLLVLDNGTFSTSLGPDANLTANRSVSFPDISGVTLLNLTGNTASRPASPATGYIYFDTTLGLPVWWNGAAWVDATGTPA